MAVRVDIALNNNELLVINGDFAYAESDTQHVIDTMNALPGWWKENPIDGVGIILYSKASSSLSQLNRNVQVQLISDGYKVDGAVFDLNSTGELLINPNATIQ